MAQAKTAAETVLRAYEVDAIYGGNGPMAMGAVGAIEALGKNPQDYFVATIDALPEVLEAIGEGKIDVALDQPCPFYTPLAVYYLVEFLEKGEEALPKPGDIVTAEDVNIEGKIHQGVDIWAHMRCGLRLRWLRRNMVILGCKPEEFWSLKTITPWSLFGLILS